MIVATAGHVDHGKTSLVKALTGIDTDRLEEEKRRGLSIDLGFAHADFGDGAAIGFVDVPGHERFIRNMAAGVACIDLALLVVAADDGPMPQTVEHVAILEWLGAPRCIVALTKVDRVDAEQADAAGAAIAALLARGRFRGSPVFPVAAPSGLGLEALRTALRAAGATRPSRSAAGQFRLAIDRTFTVAGAGLVVTGAVVAGRAALGDALLVSPQGLAVRVRGIQVHGRTATQAVAGQRCALNLAGSELKRSAIGRGDWIIAPAVHAPTDRIDVRLGASATLKRPLRHDDIVQLHLAAVSVVARLALLQGRALEPGTDALVQLVLERPIGALHGDRFIVRDPAGNRTVGGGTVVDPFGWPRGRAKPERLAELDALALPSLDAALLARLEQAPGGIDFGRFAQAHNLTACEAVELLQGKQAITVDAVSGTLLPLRDATLAASTAGTIAIAASHWQPLLQAIVAALDALHAREPDRIGPTESALAGLLGRRSVDALLRAAIRRLLDDAGMMRDGVCLRRPDHRPRLSDADQALLDRVGGLLRAAGLRPPIVGELAKTLDAALPTLIGELTGLARRGHLVQVAKNRFFLPETVVELGRIAAEMAAAAGAPGFDAAAYRDRSGIGRNLTIEVLEFLDRAGVTRFRGGRRSLVAPAPVLT